MTSTLVATDIVTRITDTYHRADSATFHAGSSWYREAQELAIELSELSGHTVEQCAAVISHLSPRVKWDLNVIAARELVLNGTRAKGIMNAPFDRAMRAFNAENPIDTFGGPKTKRFFLNICGDESVVTVDTWILKVVGMTDKELGRKGVYEAIESAYQVVAIELGITASALQAITWIVIRGAAK